MRYFITLFICFLTFMNASEKKIIIGSYDSLKSATKQLQKLQTNIASNLINALNEQNASLHARSSGKMFIIAIEPLKDFNTAKKISTLLPPTIQKNILINNYTNYKKNENHTNLANKKVALKETKISIQEKKVATKMPQISDIEEKKVPINMPTLDNINYSAKKPLPKNEKSEHKIDEKLHEKEINIQFYEENKTSIEQTQPLQSTNGIVNFIQSIKNGIISVLSILYNSFINFIFYISIFILAIAIIIYLTTQKNIIDLKQKIKTLENATEIKTQQAQNLKLDNNHLKLYYNNLTQSFKTHIDSLKEYFNNLPPKQVDENIFKTLNAIHLLLNSHEELDGDISLEKKEFNLNVLIKNTVLNEKTKFSDNINIIVDFNLPMLKKVVGDKQKIARVLSILLEFTCINTKNGRVLVALNQVSQNVDGDIMISVMIKGNKNGFNTKAIEQINQALLLVKPSKDVPKQIEELSIAKRLVESMNGKISLQTKVKHESKIIFDFSLKVINTRAIQENFFSRRIGIKLDVLFLGDETSKTQEIKNELNSLNVNNNLSHSYDDLRIKLYDIYTFIDLIIIQNSDIQNVNLHELVTRANYKNAAVLVIMEENEIENDSLKALIAQQKAKQTDLRLKILKRPYSKEELLQLIFGIYEKQKPKKLSSDIE